MLQTLDILTYSHCRQGSKLGCNDS